MKRVIKLTERDLSRIVRRVINEGLVQNQFYATYQPKQGEQNTAWPQKTGATGSWKEEGGAILLFDRNGEQIGVISGS